MKAQRAMLARYGVEADRRFVDVPSIEGRTHALVSGEGSPVVMINGLGTPAAELQVVGWRHAPWLKQSERIGRLVARCLRRQG